MRLVDRNVGSSCFWSMGTMRSQAVREENQEASERESYQKEGIVNVRAKKN